MREIAARRALAWGMLEAGISSLFSDERPAAPEELAPADDEEIDPLEDPLEARFRELERKARLRH